MATVRVARQTAIERKNAIDETSERVAKRTTNDVSEAMGKQYRGLITSLANRIAELQAQLTEQGKKVETIGKSNIVTGKKPIPVVVTNQPQTGTAGSRAEPPLDIRIAQHSVTPNPEYGNYAVQFILATNKTMNGGRVVVTCNKGKINRGRAEIPGAILLGGGSVLDDHSYRSDVTSPNWSPDFPLLITLYFDGDDLGTCFFRPLQ